MKNILPILAMVLTAVATLTAVVMCLAMGANSTPAQLRALKLWMCGLSLLGVAGIGVGIVLLRAGNTSWAAGVAFAPAVVIALISAVAILK